MVLVQCLNFSFQEDPLIFFLFKPVVHLNSWMDMMDVCLLCCVFMMMWVPQTNTLLIINLPPVSLSLSLSALQTTQPPKVLFPPERQDTVIEITPGKD